MQVVLLPILARDKEYFPWSLLSSTVLAAYVELEDVWETVVICCTTAPMIVHS